MKLRFIVGFLILILIASLTCNIALADMIWTPKDEFFEKEYQSCFHNGRSYTASGVDGLVTVFRAPGSDEAVTEVKNGSTFYVSYTYIDQNREKWGVVEFEYDDAGNVTPDYIYKGETGWIRMAELSVIYDYISFAEDHQSEFKPYTGAYNEFKTGEKIVFWSYPGSGVIVREDEIREIGKLFSITQTFTDNDNGVWGFVDYYYGTKNVWVCISDPTGAGLEVAQPSAPSISEMPIQPGGPLILSSPEPLSLPTELMPTEHNDQAPMLFIITAIVAALVILTGVIIAVFWKKNTNKDDSAK